jgi:hypothetical protein
VSSWSVSLNARSDPFPAFGLTTLPDALAVGRFDGTAAEVIFWFGNAFYKTSLQAPSPAQQSRQDMR